MLDALARHLDADDFLDPTQARDLLQERCGARPDLATFRRIGESEKGRPIDAIELGRGPVSVSLIAGNHADEPVGPDFLRRFVLGILEEAEGMGPLLDQVRFCVVPHTNPDGEEANRTWCDRWPDFGAYLEHVAREQPGRDLEFGFPEMRVENAAVAAWLREQAPMSVHGSLHGMAIGEGALLLIERHWAYRAHRLQADFLSAVGEEGLPLHDHNRQGEKGFFYLGEGLWTTPEGEAMRAFFNARGDEETAGLFYDSSMEYVRSLGGDPLCYVTELPLFLIEKRAGTDSGIPKAYLQLKDELPGLNLLVSRGEPITEEIERFGLRPLDLATALRLQLRVLSAAIEQALAVK